MRKTYCAVLFIILLVASLPAWAVFKSSSNAPSGGGAGGTTDGHIPYNSGGSFINVTVGSGLAFNTHSGTLTNTGTAVAGSDKQVQLNNNGVLYASSGLTFNSTSGLLSNTGSLYVHGVYDGVATVPASGAGTRMFFDPKRAAFRAGYASGTEWDNASEGIYSTAAGYGTIASGSYSVALGGAGTASGYSSVAFGDSTVASGIESMAMGQLTTASATNSTAMGFHAAASGGGSTAMGEYTAASGIASTASGYSTTASGDYSAASGYVTIASGADSTALGSYATAQGGNSFAIGLSTTSTATVPTISGTSSLGIFMQDQHNVNMSASNSMALLGGKMIINPATGSGAGMVSTPAAALDVAGAIKLSDTAQNCSHATDTGSLRYNSSTFVLQSCHNGSGWANVGSGLTTPGGSDQQVQLNNNGVFYASTGLTYSSVSGRLAAAVVKFAGGEVNCSHATDTGSVRYNSSTTLVQYCVNGSGWLNVGSAGGTVTVANGKNHTVSNSLTLTGTDGDTFDVTSNKKRIVGFSTVAANVAQQGSYPVAPCNGTITGWDIAVDAGTATVKAWKIPAGTASPTSGNSINTSGVAISSGTAIESTDVTDFTTTAITAGDIWGFQITAASGVTRLGFDVRYNCTKTAGGS